MSLLKNVSKGIIDKAHFICMYGTPGVGKTSFAADSPSPLFIDFEGGTDKLDVSRVSINSITELNLLMGELRNEKHDYKTIVIDSIDHLYDSVICKEVEAVNGKPIEKMKWGRGFKEAATLLKFYVEELYELRETKGINVIFIGHSKIKKTNNPLLTEDYDKFELRLPEGASAIIKEKVDALLFANYEVFLQIDEDGGKNKGIGDGSRLIHTTCMPTFDAKNRYNLPTTIKLDMISPWKVFQEACNASVDRPIGEVNASIISMISSLQNEDLELTVGAKHKEAGSDMNALLKIENRLKELTNN